MSKVASRANSTKRSGSRLRAWGSLVTPSGSQSSRFELAVRRVDDLRIAFLEGESKALARVVLLQVANRNAFDRAPSAVNIARNNAGTQIR